MIIDIFFWENFATLLFQPDVRLFFWELSDVQQWSDYVKKFNFFQNSISFKYFCHKRVLDFSIHENPLHDLLCNRCYVRKYIRNLVRQRNFRDCVLIVLTILLLRENCPQLDFLAHRCYITNSFDWAHRKEVWSLMWGKSS